VRAGLTRQDILDLKGISTEKAATAVCVRWLEEANLLSRSGSCTLTGVVMDDKGIPWPASVVQSGDEVRFPDVADRSYRKLTAPDYDHPSRKGAHSLDGPPEGVQALLERYQARLVSFGIN
jgi:hypothetical protein